MPTGGSSEENSNTNESTTEAESQEESLLSQFSTNLNELAIQGQTDPLVGRAAEVERVSQILVRRRKNNPLLVGESVLRCRHLPLLCRVLLSSPTANDTWPGCIEIDYVA